MSVSKLPAEAGTTAAVAAPPGGLEPDSYSFGPFTLRPARRLLNDGDAVVTLGARAFDLLVALVEARDRTITKAELIRRVWPGNAVEENNLTVNISVLRKGLREQPGARHYIRTIPGRGYRFVAPVVPGDQTPTGPPGPAAAIPETTSIAVLPFATMSASPEQAHWGEGIAEDIISALSRNRWLTVIARNSSFTFRDGPNDRQPNVPEIARKLGVRYVLSGSVRTAGHQVRVSAHLVDAATSRALVAESFDRELSDLFAVQDQITALITDAVRPALIEAEQERSLRKHPDSIDAWAAYQCGVWHFSRFQEPASRDAHRWFERAIELDERFAPGHYGLALVHLHDGSGYIPGVAPDWQTRGEALALRAVALDPRDSGAHAVLGLARMVRGDHDGALAATAEALSLNPSEASAYGTRGATLVFSGAPEQGLLSLADCLRLSPRDPRLHVRFAHVGLGQFFAGQHAAAEATALDIMDRWPQYALGPRLLAMICGETGRPAEGRAAIQAALALSPAPFDNFVHDRMPWYGAAAFARARAALRRTGWCG